MFFNTSQLKINFVCNELSTQELLDIYVFKIIYRQ